jgi:GxxExxY protein
LGAGYPEKVYRKALAVRIRSKKIDAQEERYCKIEIDGQRIGHFFIDMLISGKVAVELKARGEIYKKDIAQLLTYLKANNIKIGLILLFGKNGVDIKRLVY